MANEELENNNTEETSELELVEVDEKEKITTDDDQEQIFEDETKEDTKEYEVQQKLSKIQKILIGVVAFLFIIISIGAVLYYMGYFDPPPPPKKQTINKEIKKDKKYHFKASDIDAKRLNRKLSLLTKYELVLPPKVEEKPKKIEKKKTEEPKKEELKVIKNKKIPKEETTTKKDLNKSVDKLEKPIKNEKTKEVEKKQEEEKQEEKKVIVQDTKKDKTKLIKNIPEVPKYTGDEFLKFIQVATLKYKLYKSFLNQVKAIDARISICSYKKDKTQIFIGPFNDDKKRDILVKKINTTVVNDAFKIEFTQEEFNKRCNF
jgi:hypothetical protein